MQGGWRVLIDDVQVECGERGGSTGHRAGADRPAAVLLLALVLGAAGGAACSGKARPRPVDGGGGGGTGAGTDASDTGGGGPDGPGATGGQAGARDGGGEVSDALGEGGDGIAGLASIEVTPSTQTVQLSPSGAGFSATATFVATGHFSDGHSEDLSARVAWTGSFDSVQVSSGTAVVGAPGSYTIRATSGALSGAATLLAALTGSRVAGALPSSVTAALDGTPVAATTIAYPLEHAIVPPNLTPLQVQIARTSAAQSAARLRFVAGALLDLSYYAPCQPDAGGGCSVDLPEEITRLFLAVSEGQDLTLTARVGGLAAPLNESAGLQLAWANLPLSGGLYYWASVEGSTRPGAASSVRRYDFRRPGATQSEVVYTDQGAPPGFQGSPPATADGSTCIGCHAISGDGKTMALTVGSSGAPDIALLDLTTLKLTVLDAPAAGGSTDPTAVDYYKQFRRAGIATETTFGPRGDVLVSMYRSGLFLRGTTASLLSQGRVAPSWYELESDPFWSASGKLFVFTSFEVPDIGLYNSDGLNGDMKRGGQIMIATASDTAVNDDARVLVARQANRTSYYPAVSGDDQLVVFDQSTCSIDPDIYDPAGVPTYGSQTCDGYDDSSGSLWLTTPAGAAPVRLDRLNGGPANDNSRPQWGPASGTFRGQQMYWLAFSSRRAYGLQLNPGPSTSTRPQLWLGAVLIGGSLSADPSFAPVWLPGQNLAPAGGTPNQAPSRNHTPQWTRVAVRFP